MTDETSSTPPASSGAAAELFNDRPVLKEPPANFANSENYVDQRGHLRDYRPTEAVQRDYEQLIKDQEYYARRAAFERAKGDPLAENEASYWPEAIEAKKEAFKRAALEDGHVIVEPVPDETKRAADLAMIHMGAKASDYSVDLSSIPNADPGTAGEMRAFAAALEFLPGAGAGLLDRLVKVTAERNAAKVDTATWNQFVANQRAALLQRAGGSEETLNAQISEIRSMLLAVQGPGANLAHSLAENAGSLDRFVFNNLLRQAMGRQQFYRIKAKH
jgi:hypothetical protein